MYSTKSLLEKNFCVNFCNFGGNIDELLLFTSDFILILFFIGNKRNFIERFANY